MTSTCEFCETALPREEPANVALLSHMSESPECHEQFEFLVDNIRASWTSSMSGG